ncbi:hypothetical protein ACVMIX_003851 [Rhizobium leguminosarum]
MRDIGLGVGYFPIATAGIGIYVYVKYILSKKFDFYIYAFASFFASVFVISAIFRLIFRLSIENILLAQLLSVSLIFVLVRIAVIHAAASSTRILIDRGLPVRMLILMFLVPTSIVIIIDYLVANTSSRCTGAKCGVLQFVFGSDDVFTSYYFTNLCGSVFLTLSALSINALTRRFLR